jgi:ADP-heptose:LPS heptosyltransferase
MSEWRDVKNLLVVRLDNMGDLIMSSPAIRALKKTLNCKITLLTSSMAKEVAGYIKTIDEVIVYDVPWVKVNHTVDVESFNEIVRILKERNFDAAVMFTVFSQNPLPAALLLMLANIPRRLAYCRENPYQLLTDWIPEKEPYTFIRHQVKRDMDLVAHIGAGGSDEIFFDLPEKDEMLINQKLIDNRITPEKPWILLHPGVSEKKREYPVGLWRTTIEKILDELHCQIVVTGSVAEVSKVAEITEGFSKDVYSLAGKLSLEDFIFLIKLAPLVVSVNTATIHIASAVKTKLVVLYALTNPQHTPWKSVGKILTFPVPESLQSKNEVLHFLQQRWFCNQSNNATPDNIVSSAKLLLKEHQHMMIDELVI